MAVEVRYIVIRDGKEVGMYTSKKEADAHDKMLDIAENLYTFIEKADHLDLNDTQLDELSIYLSKNRDEAIRILRGQKPPKPPEEVIEEDTGKPHPAKGKKAGKEVEEETSKSPRAKEKKAGKGKKKK